MSRRWGDSRMVCTMPSSVNPGPNPRRKRLRSWLSAFAAAAVAALVVEVVHVWSRFLATTGVDYYFPEWRIPMVVSDAEADRRLRLLAAMGPEQACPILIEGVAQGYSESGALWEESLKWLKTRIGDPVSCLPRYSTGRTYWFLSGLASDATNQTVAKSVAGVWPSWDAVTRSAFLECLATSGDPPDPALFPVLVSAMAHPDGYAGEEWAADVAVGITNRPSELDAALSGLPRLSLSVLRRLAANGVLSDRLESALLEGPDSNEPQSRFWYALTLARCLPERHPPEKVLGELLDVEQFRTGWGDMEHGLVKSKVFQPVLSTPFFRRRCLEILAAPDMDPIVRERVLRVLAQVASPDSETAVGLRPWLTAAESELFPMAMRAFLASASPEPDNVELAAAGLTQKQTCVATLLWLTEAGTNAMPLASAVEALARDSSPRSPGTQRPSGAVVRPNTDIPRRLLAVWPRRDVPNGSGNSRLLLVPEVSLTNLAGRCLRRMRGEPLE